MAVTDCPFDQNDGIPCAKDVAVIAAASNHLLEMNDLNWSQTQWRLYWQSHSQRWWMRMILMMNTTMRFAFARANEIQMMVELVPGPVAMELMLHSNPNKSASVWPTDAYTLRKKKGMNETRKIS